MKHDNTVYIKHALEAAEKAIGFINNKNREDLHKDEMLALATIRLPEIIGEAANCVSDRFKNKYPEIPWNKMIAMRNRLIHGYFDINYDIVWDTLKNDLPQLIKKLETIKEE